MVENDEWIGFGVTIMPGVKIGNGAIIATKTVVTKDVESYSIVGGNPAKEIRKRFSKENINTLQEIKWWDWPIEKITENTHNLTGDNIEKLKENA
jgi:virginiamycin A acetyltransferase